MLRITLLALVALAPSALAQSTTLPFDGLAGTNLNAAGYADRVTGPSTGGFTYTGTGTFTPNIVATFGCTSSGNPFPMYPWTTGYNSLINVVYAPVGGSPGLGDELVVTLVADPGFEATLEAFDVGNWGPAIDVPYLRVIDEAGAVLFEELLVPLNVNTSPVERNYAFSPPLAGRVLRLVFGLEGLGGNADNVGLDNLRFGQRPRMSNEIGAAYCGPGVANSSSGPGEVRGWGQSAALANDVSLFAWGLPIGAFGFFLTSRTQGFVANPGGSVGDLCLGGAIGRYVGPGQIQNTGPNGDFSLRLDLMRMPTPTGLVAAQAGETWSFQAWHRDVGSTSNFTAGLALTLQ